MPAGQAEGGALLRSARGLALRGLRSIRRLPSAFFPALAMPIFQTIAFSGTFFAITKIPGFPTDRSVNWYLPLATCMGSGFSGIGLGFSTVRDIESGFFDRLRMAPAPRLALIIGPLITAWIRVLIVITSVLIVGFLFGARLTGGVVGLITLYLAGLGIATAAAGWALGLAYRFGDMRAAALMQLTLLQRDLPQQRPDAAERHDRLAARRGPDQPVHQHLAAGPRRLARRRHVELRPGAVWWPSSASAR